MTDSPFPYLTALRHLFCVLLMGVFLTGCGAPRTIVNNLDEREANEIIVFLSSKGIVATKTQAASDAAGGAGKAVMWNINVDTDQANEAMSLLNQAGLPRKRSQNLLGIFSNVGLVPSAMQEKIRYQAGLAEQIASTIRKIDGVLDADVQISFPEEDPLNPTATKGKITASVYVKHNGILDDPNAHLISRIKRLVAGSVNGLEYDNVTVIGDRTRFSETSLGGGTFGEEEHPFVHVWSLTIAKDALTRFRIIFFSFTITILLLLIALIWLLWKIFPLLKETGGAKELFTIHPLTVHKTEAPPPLKKETEEEIKEEEHSDEGGIT